MKAVVFNQASGFFVNVQGTFYRSVRGSAIERALAGSTAPGRYSSAQQSVLYMSSSEEGVEAAMTDYRSAMTEPSALCRIEVDANRILDLRDESACDAAGIRRSDALCDWKAAVASGSTPPSWHLADRLRNLGASGLIDPSRKAPGLWHLTLFNWNGPEGTSVRVLGPGEE